MATKKNWKIKKNELQVMTLPLKDNQLTLYSLHFVGVILLAQQFFQIWFYLLVLYSYNYPLDQ